MVFSLSGILAICFYFASLFGYGHGKNQKVIILFLFIVLSELIRSELFLDFPWGLIASIWINTPLSQSLALFGPYWLSAITILSAFLLSRPWLGSILGLSIMLALWSFGYNRLNLPLVDRSHPVKVRIVQPNIKQSEKWKPELAASFLNKQVEMSKNAKETGVDIVIWPETAISYGVQDEKNLRELIAFDLDVALVLGARRFDKENKKLYNSAFLLAKNGDILNVYDKIKLVPFGEYIPFGKLLAHLGVFGLAEDRLLGFSSGEFKGLFETNEFGTVKILICYEAIFSDDMFLQDKRPSWMIHITNDAWFGSFSGPQQHLTLARMRAIERGLPLVRSANTGISAMIGPYGRIQSQLGLGKSGSIDEFLPSALKQTFYSRLGPQLWIFLLISVLILTIVILILIKLLNRSRSCQ
jgi:apolipoprotein N-acyltransferase